MLQKDIYSSMKTSTPTSKELEELIAFLPRLYSQGAALVKEKESKDIHNQDQFKVISMPLVEYTDVVLEFFHVASQECWRDYDYQPENAAQMLEDHAFIQGANLDQIKTMLTYCVRGERFCEGHWEVMIEDGHIFRLLQRLCELKKQYL